ncbi:glycoside hydrolase family 43 protein [Cellulomonas triticagri]|uniref:Glycoside hydrolase family 43 protein n=1 Tax=Cellulomonas triticagri TaxID=2483352 RepID=A0A3M2J831_9CELL|nr:glycoside hydrolase family 43 protein [Cellulomonas triticagri]RMI09579.1 glycoside hydrolase family 43 protein [Cellulomonas triticagri]
MIVTNPLLPGCYPDPSVCRVGDDYFLVTSTFEYLPGLPVLRSRDLATWEQIGHVVDRPGQLDLTGIASSGGLYAPTLRHHDGVFWLIGTLVARDGDRRPAGVRDGTFVMTATDPAGPWSDPAWLDVDGIDPSLLFDADGRVWAHGTRLAADPEWDQQTEVWVRELDPATRTLVGPEHVVWTGAVRGAVWAEGPHLYRVGDRYLLLAAEGGTEFHHAVAVAVADEVTGPYRGNPANPVLTHRHLGRSVDVVGTGHADLVEAADGTWWAVLLGMRLCGGYHYPLGREAFLVPVTWEDGWPVFAPGVGRVPQEVEVPFAVPTGPRTAVQGGASGPVLPDDLRWTAVRALPAQVATPAADGWDLPLRPVTLADPVAAPTFVGIRLQHHHADLRAVVAAPLRAGDEVGLAVRQSERDHVRLAVTAVPGPGPGTAPGRRVVAVHRRAGEDHEVGAATLPGPVDAPTALGVEVRGAVLHLTAADGDETPVRVGTVRTGDLDSVAAGGFLGLWLGPYASATTRSPTLASVRAITYAPAP